MRNDLTNLLLRRRVAWGCTHTRALVPALADQRTNPHVGWALPTNPTPSALSPVGATESSPGRKPWVAAASTPQAPERRQIRPAAAHRTRNSSTENGTRRALACSFALLFVATNIARAAESPEQRFAEAQALFDSAKQMMQTSGADSIEARRKYHDAATRFAAIARDGVVSPNLCVNAGNSYYFAGDHARALLWYLRAMRLANTPDTRNGVAALRRTCGAELWPPEPASIGRALMSWHYDVGRRTRQRIMFATYPLGCALVIVSLFAKRKPIWLRLGLVLICVGATMGISDIVTGAGPLDRWAVVVEDGKGYAGDGEAYSVVLPNIKPGQEVKLIETRPEWLRVALPSGTTCWVRAAICEPV